MILHQPTPEPLESDHGPIAAREFDRNIFAARVNFDGKDLSQGTGWATALAHFRPPDVTVHDASR